MTLETSTPALPVKVSADTSPELYDRLLTDAHLLTFQALAELAQSAEPALASLYARCLEQRLELKWGRVANWHIWTKGESEREGIRLANVEVGATTEERVLNALNGRLDSTEGEEEARQAASRESDLVDQCLSSTAH